MRIVVAPNAFKNSLNASEAARSIIKGLVQSKLNCDCLFFPVGDGGDGTGRLIVDWYQGENFHYLVENPVGRQVQARLGIIEEGSVAVIEMADASGIRLMEANTLSPLSASSIGTGELIRHALDRNVKRIIIGMGGSATVDGGMGILYALGIRFFDKANRELAPRPDCLVQMTRIDNSNLDPRIKNCEIVILCDVKNKLLGPAGSAAVFGPQKGASAADIVLLEKMLTTFNDITKKQKGIQMDAFKHGGTAGGAAAGLKAWLGARLVSGIDYYLQFTDFESALMKCDLLITGEGSIDLQTLDGKAPAGVAKRAKARGIPVLALGGRVDIKQHKEMKTYFDVLLSIGNEPNSVEEAIASTEKNLIRVAKEIGDLLYFSKLAD